MPRPEVRASEFTDELMTTFDHALSLRAERERLKDELNATEKRLQVLMREMFGEHWSFGGTSPADEALHVPRHHPIGSGIQLDRDWPNMMRDRAVMVAEHAKWKQQRGPP
jgi:hypothetical protein